MSRFRFIDAQKANHSIRLMCRVLDVRRSCYYQWRNGITYKDRDAQLRVHIKAIHRHHEGRYGAPRITPELRAHGFEVNHKRVARIMREMGLKGKPKKRFKVATTDSTHSRPVADNLLNRDFTTTAPNQALVADITYVPTRAGVVYLAVILDLFSRKVVGWSVAEHMETSLCLSALRQASLRGELSGCVHHSDRGSQYASVAYRSALSSLGLVCSMSRKGNCWDNAVAESFFGTLEQELIGESDWADLFEARTSLSRYIHKYYNAIRRHSTLGYLSPVEFETQHRLKKERAA